MDVEAQSNRTPPWQAAKIAVFLNATSGFRHVMKPYLAAVALRTNGSNVIVAARLTFASPTVRLLERHFESTSIQAIAMPLPNNSAAEEILSAFAAGSIEIGNKSFLFPPEDGSEIKVDVDSLHQGAGIQTRSSVLTMQGRTTAGLLDQDQLDWELKAASPPYLTFQELLYEFGVPMPQGVGIFVADHALPIAIDGQRSCVDDHTASISIKAERGIVTGHIQVGLIALKTGEKPYRRQFGGKSLSWDDDGQFLLGVVQCDVPSGRPVQAVASLQGRAIHYWWLVDPLQIPNTRKAVYEVVDADLVTLRDFIVASAPKGAARDLESAVAWLLWMLGFSVAHLGTNTRTQDAVDILAVTPNGNFALVECTTGVISTDKKVANLLSRRAVVLERLARANHNNVRVLPVIVTSKGRDEVQQEIRPAQERGVFVVTRDDLMDLLNRTNMLPNADELYNNAESQIGAALLSEPPLPGIS